MQFQVLGSAGCIGGEGLSSCYRVGPSILIDAGTGLGALSQEALERIDHVFLTHSHMDHVALLPLLADAVLRRRHRPVTVHGTEVTLAALSEHIFNWNISPDFRVLPSTEEPILQFSQLQPGVPVQVEGCALTAIPVEHSIPTVAYQVDSGAGSLVLATDMSISDDFWPVVNKIDKLQWLLIEAAFGNDCYDVCQQSGHLCPSMLEQELKRFDQPQSEVCIIHVKPTALDTVKREIAAFAGARTFRFLVDDEILDF